MSIESEILEMFNELSSVDFPKRTPENRQIFDTKRGSVFSILKKDKEKEDVDPMACTKCGQVKNKDDYRKKLASHRVNKRVYRVRVCRECERKLAYVNYQKNRHNPEFKIANIEKTRRYRNKKKQCASL